MTPKARRLVRGWLLVGVGLWILAVVVSLVEARGHLFRARDELRALQGTNVDDVDLDGLSVRLRSVDGELSQADAKLTSWALAPLRPLPVIGRHLSVARSLAGSAAAVSSAGIEVLDTIDSARGDASPSRAGVIREIEAELAIVAARLAEFDIGPTDNLLPGFTETQADIAVTVSDAAEQAEEVLVVVRGVASFLDDSDYVLLGANNSEMMLGSGMVLSIGEVNADDGDVVIGEFGPSDERFPVPTRPPSGLVALDPDVEARWGFLYPTNDYRKLTFTARFAEYSAPQGMRMWRAQTGRQVEGAMLIDPFVIDAILGVIGPVEVDGEMFSAGMALDYLLVDQYRQFEGGATETSQRRDRLSALAAAVATRLGQGDFDPVALARAMPALIEGRHLMLYSDDPDEQAAWRAIGATGELSGNETGLYLMNTGASKLDPYVEMDVQVTMTDAHREGARTVRYTVTVTNTVTDGESLPSYTVGPWDFVPLAEAGTYAGRLAVYAPAVASGLRFRTEQPLEVYGADGQVWVMGTHITVRPGRQEVIEVEYEIPEDFSLLEVEPSGRFPAVRWSFEGAVVDDSRRFSIDLGAG